MRGKIIVGFSQVYSIVMETQKCRDLFLFQMGFRICGCERGLPVAPDLRRQSHALVSRFFTCIHITKRIPERDPPQRDDKDST